MDPVTLIGLLASISSLVGASQSAVKLMKSFKDGDRELSELISQVDLFAKNLEGFDRVFRSRQAIQRPPTDTLTTAIEDSFSRLEELERRLLQIAKAESSAMRRLRWIQNKSALKDIGENIKTKCAMLHSLVSVAQMEMLLAACSHNPQLFEICAQAAGEMEREEAHARPRIEQASSGPTVPLLMAPEDDISPSVQSLINSSTPHQASPENQLLSPGTWNSPRRSSESFIQRPHRLSVSSASSLASSAAESSVFTSNISASSSVSDVDLVPPESSLVQVKPAERTVNDSLIIRRACRFDCYCKCHDLTTFVPDNVFSKFKTPIFRERKSQKIECSEPDCAGAEASVSQNKAIPTAFFKKAMSSLLSMQPIKVGYHLANYRMVPEGSNALRYIKQGNLEKLKSSIRSGETTPFDTAPDGWSLLHTAVYARQLPTVKYLCELGADTEVADFGARKPVDLAMLKFLAANSTANEKDIVRVFSKDDDYVSDFEFTPIHIAVLDLYDTSDSERPSLEQLIEFVDNANNAPRGTNWAQWKAKYKKRSPLFLDIIAQFSSSATGNPSTHKVMHNLLDQKDRKFHWTPLHWASATGKVDKMRTLIKSGADPFIQSNISFNIIHSAVEANAVHSLEYALQLSKSYPEDLNINRPNTWGETPLLMAAQGGLVECIKLLLKNGADRDARQENGQVALHYAGLSKRSSARRKTLALLCEKEDGNTDITSHINAQDEDGRPPIFEFLDDSECLRLLVRHDARLDLADEMGENVFHHACIQDEDEQLEILMELSADLPKQLWKEKDRDGNTPLLLALRHHSIKCAKVLLALSDVGDIVDQEGWAAVHHATKLGDSGLLEMALKHPSFKKGAKTVDGKTAQVVAMEAGTWCGQVKALLRKYNSLA